MSESAQQITATHTSADNHMRGRLEQERKKRATVVEIFQMAKMVHLTIRIVTGGSNSA